MGTRRHTQLGIDHGIEDSLSSRNHLYYKRLTYAIITSAGVPPGTAWSACRVAAPPGPALNYWRSCQGEPIECAVGVEDRRGARKRRSVGRNAASRNAGQPPQKSSRAVVNAARKPFPATRTQVLSAQTCIRGRDVNHGQVTCNPVSGEPGFSAEKPRVRQADYTATWAVAVNSALAIWRQSKSIPDEERVHGYIFPDYFRVSIVTLYTRQNVLYPNVSPARRSSWQLRVAVAQQADMVLIHGTVLTVDVEDTV